MIKRVEVPEPDVCRTCGDPDCIRPEGHEVEEPRTMCDICGRDIEPTREVPLCRSCEGTARAAGRQEQDARRYPDPERAEVVG